MSDTSLESKTAMVYDDQITATTVPAEVVEPYPFSGESYVSMMSMIWVTIVFYVLIIGILMCCAAALVFTRSVYKRRAQRKLVAEKEKCRRLEERLRQDELRIKERLGQIRERELELKMQQQTAQFKAEMIAPRESKHVCMPPPQTQAAPPVNVYLPPQPYVYPAPDAPKQYAKTVEMSPRTKKGEEGDFKEEHPICGRQNVHWSEEILQREAERNRNDGEQQWRQWPATQQKPRSETSDVCSLTTTPTRTSFDQSRPSTPSVKASTTTATVSSADSKPSGRKTPSDRTKSGKDISKKKRKIKELSEDFRMKMNLKAPSNNSSTTTVSMSSIVGNLEEPKKTRKGEKKSSRKKKSRRKVRDQISLPREKVAMHVKDVGGMVDQLAASRAVSDKRLTNQKIELTAADSTDQSTLRPVPSILSTDSFSTVQPSSDTTSTVLRPDGTTNGTMDTLDDPRFRSTLYRIPPEDNPVLSANPYWRSQSNRKMEIDRKKSPTTGKLRHITVKAKENTTWFPPANYNNNFNGKRKPEKDAYPMYATVHHKPPSTGHLQSSTSSSGEVVQKTEHMEPTQPPQKHKAARVNLLKQATFPMIPSVAIAEYVITLLLTILTAHYLLRIFKYKRIHALWKDSPPLAVQFITVTFLCIAIGLYCILWILASAKIIPNDPQISVIFLVIGLSYLTAQNFHIISCLAVYAQRIYILIAPLNSLHRANRVIISASLLASVLGACFIIVPNAIYAPVNVNPVPDGCYSFNCSPLLARSDYIIAVIVFFSVATVVIGTLLQCVYSHSNLTARAENVKVTQFARYAFYFRILFETLPFTVDFILVYTVVHWSIRCNRLFYGLLHIYVAVLLLGSQEEIANGASDQNEWSYENDKL
uniref:G_PROTEIN_RECEP_F1_2 domain-containing protein n=1 Tax=Steinernema glaseri TaxID=37863 RepID=A0A1I7XXI4_9BILA